MRVWMIWNKKSISINEHECKNDNDIDNDNVKKEQPACYKCFTSMYKYLTY